MKAETKGEIYLIFSSLVIAVVAVLVKFVSGTFNSLFISGFRFLVAILLGLIILKITKQKFKVYGKRDWILRGVFGSTAMICYYTAIQFTSSGRATLLFNTFPIFVALFGLLIFKKHISKRNLTSIAVCLLGVIFVFYDGSSYPLKGDIIGLIGGILAGITVHYIKKSSEQNHPLIVYLAACFCGSLYLPLAVNQVFEITLFSFLVLLIIGALSLVGQVCMTYGYRYVSANKGSIISYFSIPFTLILSYFIGEEFKFRFFVGIFLILIGLVVNRK